MASEGAVASDVIQTAYPVFVLTLRGDDERRAPLLRQLADRGIPHQLVYGVDGRGGLAPDDETRVDREAARQRHGRLLADSELAASLSHHDVYERVAKDGLAGAIVLEDDAILTDGFVEFLRREDYRRFDMVLLDHWKAWVAPDPLEEMPGYRIHRLALSPDLATGYTISRRAAAYLLQETTPVRAVPDWPGDIASFGAVAVHPRLVDHPDPESGVSHLRDGRDLSFRTAGGKRGRRRFSRFFTAAYWSRRREKRRHAAKLRRSIRIS